MLSEELSAERPSDEPARSSGPEGSPSGGTPHVGIGLTPGRGEHRGPELIENGMVHVDPDPEIGSPPRAAGWAEHQAGQTESEEPGRSPVEGRPAAAAPGPSQARDSSSSTDPVARVTAGPGPGTSDVETDTRLAPDGSESVVGDGSDADAVVRDQGIAIAPDPSTIAKVEEGTDGTSAGTEAAGTEAAGTDRGRDRGRRDRGLHKYRDLRSNQGLHRGRGPRDRDQGLRSSLERRRRSGSPCSATGGRRLAGKPSGPALVLSSVRRRPGCDRRRKDERRVQRQRLTRYPSGQPRRCAGRHQARRCDRFRYWGRNRRRAGPLERTSATDGLAAGDGAIRPFRAT